MPRHLTILMCLLVRINSADADYIDYDFQLNCRPSENTAEIVPLSLVDKNGRGIEPQDCIFKNGRTVRVKVAKVQKGGYGRSSGAADPAISVWIDQRKLVSAQPVGCIRWEEGPCDPRITVSENGMEICFEKQPTEPDGLDLTSPRSTTERKSNWKKCEFTSNNQFSAQKDAVEFPGLHDRMPPKELSKAIVYERNADLCGKFDLSAPDRTMWGNINMEIPLPAEAKGMEQQKPLRDDTPEGLKRYSIDINNDGRPEVLIAYNYPEGRENGDRYYIYRDLTDVNLGVKTISVGADRNIEEPTIENRNSAVSVLPDDWAVSDAQVLAGNNAGYYVPTDVSAPWWSPNDTPAFALANLYLQPFTYKGTTYVRTASADPAVSHWHVVLKVAPDYSATTMCAFQTVQPRM